jgi:hypothetical protein
MSLCRKNINTLTTTQIQPLLLDYHPEHDEDGHFDEDSGEGNDDNDAGGGDDD